MLGKSLKTACYFNRSKPRHCCEPIALSPGKPRHGSWHVKTKGCRAKALLKACQDRGLQRPCQGINHGMPTHGVAKALLTASQGMAHTSLYKGQGIAHIMTRQRVAKESSTACQEKGRPRHCSRYGT
ncbi:hypothetical protein RHMOL_Rhmol10G0190000 [Rhododendron molle]|uniref:Uncharacterized protein n=1 Tax=Rhododendron molle TaxID=49168 RepID=A0ACC0M3V4_RHOML|nr:hypothetical protein RHMOL_Rhmol10G0190000 [Rhododendron molle]